MLTKYNLRYLKALLLVVLIIVPFSISDYSDQITPEKITSDLRFYEINTCSISLNEFLLENPNVIYQDHYKIRFNNYSSIQCFGQITGIDQIGYTFYISIGTNTIINLFLQSIIWILLISLIPKSKSFNFKDFNLLSCSLSSFLICTVLYAEQRYYSKVFFEFDLNSNKNLFYMFIYILFICFFTTYVLNSRRSRLINFVPFTFIFIGVFSGMNLYFLTLFFCPIGIEEIIRRKKNRFYFTFINFIIFFWAFNAIGSNFYLKPDKIRGLSSTAYNFLSVSSWSYLMILTIIGIYYFSLERKNYLDLKYIRNNFVISGFLIVILGYLGSSMPLANFYNYYFFGQTKYGTDDQNLFGVNYWGESEAWRGFFPSAETIGEFFAIALLLIFIINKKDGLNKYLFTFIPFLLVGLYASNNKAALISLVLCIGLYVNKERKLPKKIKALLPLPALLILFYFIRLENLFFSIDFSANKMKEMGIGYGNEAQRSSSIKFLQNLDESFFLFEIVILFFGFLAFLINRSELWGLFFARFNPTSSEFLFGTGPFILSRHYSEIDILDKKLYTGTPLGFLLPHSSFLSIFLFFGFIGMLIIFIYLFSNLFKGRKTNFELFLVCFLIGLNILKSDSILYLPSLLTYLTMFICLVTKTRNKNIFN